MPYIEPELRKKFDSKIENILKELLFHEDVIAVGEINYIITKLIHEFCVDFPGLNYHLLNNIMGVLESAKQEFYRTVVAPYEDLKRKENGSVSELDKEKSDD